MQLNSFECPLNDLNLGDKVADEVSGFEGIVTAEYYSKYNVRRLLVDATTTKEDGNLIEPNWFDETSLLLIRKDVVLGRRHACDHSHGYHFLDIVQDEVTGQMGKVLGWVYSLNGCTQIAFAPEGLDRDGNHRKHYDLHIGRLINHTLAERIEAAEAAKEPPKEGILHRPSAGCPRSSNHG